MKAIPSINPEILVHYCGKFLFCQHSEKDGAGKSERIKFLLLSIRQQPRNQRGILKMKVLPCPNTDSTQISPPIMFYNLFTDCKSQSHSKRTQSQINLNLIRLRLLLITSVIDQLQKPKIPGDPTTFFFSERGLQAGGDLPASRQGNIFDIRWRVGKSSGLLQSIALSGKCFC